MRKLAMLLGFCALASCGEMPLGTVEVDGGADAGVCGSAHHLDTTYYLYCVPDEPVSAPNAGTPCARGLTPEVPPTSAMVGYGYVLCK